MNEVLDFERYIYDECARAVYALYPGAYVTGDDRVVKPASFPAVSIVESGNAEVDSMRDSSGDENAVSLAYTVNAYSNSESAGRQECKAILNAIDAVFRKWNFRRSMSRPLDNAADPSIFRMVSRYSGIADKNGNVYWK